MLTPFLEQTPAYNALNFSFPVFGIDGAASPPNTTVFDMRVALFLCPSDTGRRVVDGFAPGNYMACAGNGLPGGSILWDDPNGVFYYNSATRLADITDGASQTVLMSESILGSGPGSQTTSAGTNPQEVQTEIYNAGDVTKNVPMTQAECQAPIKYAFNRNRGWVQGDCRNMIYTHYIPPNSKTYDCLRGSDYAWKTARIHHFGGVNVLLGDGSVRFIRDSVSLPTWLALATRAGGEVISGDSF